MIQRQVWSLLLLLILVVAPTLFSHRVCVSVTAHGDVSADNAFLSTSLSASSDASSSSSSDSSEEDVEAHQDESAGREAIGETAFWLATCCAWVATLLSSSHIYSHLRNYNQPATQRLILRILFMIPLYAVTCWISLMSSTVATVTDALRGCYEAFVLWMFFNLMVSFFGGEAMLLEKLNDGRPPTKHLWPFDRYLRPMHLGTRSNFLTIKRGILQYALITPVTTMLYFICPYLTMIDNITVSVSLYFLVLLYQAIAHDLVSWKPLPKFLCVKGIIFATYWQSILLSIFAGVGIIYASGTMSTSALTRAINDFLICLEMIPFALYHRYAFPTSTYPASVTTPFVPVLKALKDVIGMQDVLREGLDTIEGVWNGPQRMNIDRSGDYEAPALHDRFAAPDEAGRRTLRHGEEQLAGRQYRHGGSVLNVWANQQKDVDFDAPSPTSSDGSHVLNDPLSHASSRRYSDFDDEPTPYDPLPEEMDLGQQSFHPLQPR